MTKPSANTRDSRDAAKARFFALLPCAGQGSRAGVSAAGLSKQYQDIAGQAMVLHTLAAFAAVTRLAGTLVVVAPGDTFFDALPVRGFDVAACGGASRAATVRSGLDALRQSGAADHDWVLVHDAARCLVSAAQINQLIEACEHDAVGGLLAHKLPDTLKCEVNGRVAATLDRSDKWLAQTPQMFRIGTLAQALDAAGRDVTDESSAMEALGLAPRLVAGSAQNFKVTYPEDFALAEAVLLARRKKPAGQQTV
ncbi:MAG: 2-C-methyl-D-erythritol 4-phosphate cytidylyltransferase [Polaromonas sp.]|nr:2-C-methyl-D-erythritol 4-phosphate cytidylyltransferase [Polaromonas sp.]